MNAFEKFTSGVTNLLDFWYGYNNIGPDAATIVGTLIMLVMIFLTVAQLIVTGEYISEDHTRVSIFLCFLIPMLATWCIHLLAITILLNIHPIILGVGGFAWITTHAIQQSNTRHGSVYGITNSVCTYYKDADLCEATLAKYHKYYNRLKSTSFEI
jgi:hypothetical protein